MEIQHRYCSDYGNNKGYFKLNQHLAREEHRGVGRNPRYVGFHHMARVDPIDILTTIKYNALIYLQFDTTYPVIEGETLIWHIICES